MYRKPQDLSKSFDTFTQEVRDFWSNREATFTAWFAFMFLNVANIIVVICSATPSWSWTQEVVGQGASTRMEGEVYGHYGLWYNCFDSVMGYGRTCILWSDAAYVPGKTPKFQLIYFIINNKHLYGHDTQPSQ